MASSSRCLCASVFRGGVLVAALAASTGAAIAQDRTAFPAESLGVSSSALRQFLTDYAQWRRAEVPETGWRDWSPAARERGRVRRRDLLQQLQYIASGNLTSDERMRADAVERELRMEIEAPPDARLDAHNEVFAVIARMPAQSVRDYEHIIARLHALPSYVDQHLELWRARRAAGEAPPAAAVDTAAREIAAQRAASPDDSPLLAAFRRFPAGIPDAERARLRGAAVGAYEAQFRPAWLLLETFLRETYRPRVS